MPDTTARILPSRSPGVYDEFAAALRDWRGKTVAVRNNADSEAMRPPSILSDIRADYLVIVDARAARVMIPYSSIEMAYSSQSSTDQKGVLTIVIRR